MEYLNTTSTAKLAVASYASYALYSNFLQSNEFHAPPIRKNSPKVLIIGAGFSGICMSIKLAEKGIEHVVIEKEADIGGTWFLTQYPGAQCDVPSHGYSYSFEMNPDWTTAYAGSKEIWEYQCRVAKKYGVYERTRLNTQVNRAQWMESRQKWVVEVESAGKVETLEVDFLVSGVGGLHIPSFPKFPGVNAGVFKGEREMHSAMYDPTLSHAGKRVVVIGSAASAVQIVPAVSETATHVTCIQRTPNWLAPQRSPVLPYSLNYGPWIRWCFRHLPGVLLLQRWLVYLSMESIFFPLGAFSNAGGLGQRLVHFVLNRFMRSQLKNDTKGLADKVIPNFAVGCKRIIRSSKFLPALQKPNVDLVTDSVVRIQAEGVVVRNEKQEERVIPADVIVYATGYEVGNVGKMRIEANEAVLTGSAMGEEKVNSYYGVCTTQFPNAFLMLGPSTGLGHNSIIIMLETQACFIARTIELCAEQSVSKVTIKPEAVKECMEMIDSSMEGTVWKNGKCSSWYQSKTGDVPTLWPRTTTKYMMDLMPPNDLRVFDCKQQQQAMARF